MQNKAKKIKNFRLSLVDDETHKPVIVTRFSKTNFIVACVMAVIITCLLIYSLIAFTPIRTFIPGYPDAKAKRAAIQNAIRIDSLETIVSKWEFYSENLKRILDGEEPVRIDSLVMKYAAENKREFSEEELKVLQRVYDKFAHFGSVEISEYSHKEKGYTSTKQGEIISYAYAKEIELDK